VNWEGFAMLDVSVAVKSAEKLDKAVGIIAK
jgi:hypothetical protein